MTDKKLLELAAKAAGIEILLWNNVFKNVTGSHPASNMFAFPILNPLTDDGDALRLAVKLRLNIDINDDTGSVFVRKDWYPECEAVEGLFGDPYAATRRAIVRAAAEIGRGME